LVVLVPLCLHPFFWVMFAGFSHQQMMTPIWYHKMPLAALKITAGTIKLIQLQ